MGLKDENEALRKELADLRSLNDYLEHERAEWERQRLDCEQQRADLKMRLKEIEAPLRKRCAALEAENAELHRLNEELDKRYDGLDNKRWDQLADLVEEAKRSNQRLEQRAIRAQTLNTAPAN